MSRLTRALGFGGGDGDNRSRSTADTPKVRRIRETMRWRGYDLSDYTDEQIAAVSARFPNDISEDGETTENGRRALAAALEQGDFAPPPAPETQAEPAAEPTASPPPGPASSRRASASAAPYRRALGMPTLTERFAHVFGVHAWRSIDGEGGRMQCVGCGQVRNEASAPFRPPPSPPPPPPPPPADDPLARRENPREQPRSPLDDLPNLEDRDRMGAPPRGPQRPGQPQRSDSIWDFFMGLPWWSKLLAIFIAIQVVLFIVSAVSGGGGGG